MAFYDNEVGVAGDVGVIFNHPDGDYCAYAGRVAAYHAPKCVMFSKKFIFFFSYFYFNYKT